MGFGMNRLLPTGNLLILPAGGAVNVTTPGPSPVTLAFAPAHAEQMADELDRRAVRLFEDPDDTVTMYINAPHFQRVHITCPAHVATTLRRAAGLAHEV